MINDNEENNNFGDILEEFKTAVNNGQLRLAMIHLVDIIDAIVDVLSEEESQEQTIIAPGPISIEEPVKKNEEKLKQKEDKKPAATNTEKKTEEKSAE